MKNPLVVSSPFRTTGDDRTFLERRAPLHNIALADAAALRPALRKALVAHQGLQLFEQKEDPSKGPDYVKQVLKFLKYKPAHIERMMYYTEAIAKLAAIANWVVAAVTTIKEVLTLLGVLDRDETAEKVQRDIALKVDAIYKYLQETDRQAQFDRAVEWRSRTLRVRNALANLALSRSQDNMDEIKATREALMRDAINKMLEPGTGNIAFKRATYGGFPTPHTYVNQMPDHWTEYAFPLWMQTTGGQPVALSEAMDLAARIWDPGYYLDVLLDAIGVRIAALAATEPAFRSTGFDRSDLRTIYRGLADLVAEWEKSMFRTTIVGPIDPQLDVFGEHRLYHPWIVPSAGSFSEFGNPPALPLGVIDPVSGVAAFDPFWREGLQLSFNGIANYWTVANYADAIAAAHARQSLLMAAVREECGLQALRDMRDAVYALTAPPSGSEFASPSETTFTREDIAGAASGAVRFAAVDEQFELGVVGAFAGKPGKTYVAKRAFQPVVKRFRLPMARRMDGSKIQLGYRIRFSVGHAGVPTDPGLPIDVSAILAEYSAPDFPEQVLPLFPVAPQSHELHSDNAAVYDVLQSAVFSAAEEDAFEASGSVPNHTRLFLNRRAGSVRARVDIRLDFNPADPNHRFVGFAHVSIGTLEPTVHRDGFILFIEFFEKRVAVLPNERDEVREDPVGAMSLHFAPSFLVVERDYFTDREAGLAKMEEAVDSIEDKYRKAKLRLGPRVPIAHIERAAREERLLRETFAEYADRSPQIAQQLVERFAVPSVRRL